VPKNFSLAILDEPFQVAHRVFFLRLQEVSIDFHRDRYIRMPEIARYLRYWSLQQDEHGRVTVSEPMHGDCLLYVRLFKRWFSP
jgi:hypothetical protein